MLGLESAALSDWSSVLGLSCVMTQLLREKIFQMKEDTDEAKRVMLLALFSSPTKYGKQSLPPLQLMKEITSCIENIPHRYRVIRPAARFPEDMLHVVRELSPRMLQFSGYARKRALSPRTSAALTSD